MYIAAINDTVPMNSLPDLNFPPYRFRVSAGPPARIWDEVRACWLVLTPEEWVRRHLLRFLTETLGVTPQLISQECPVPVGGMNQRADAVVYDSAARPLLLAECKAPHVALDASVYAQGVRYNSVVGARYLLLTNGMEHKIYELTAGGDYFSLKEFPDLSAAGSHR